MSGNKQQLECEYILLNTAVSHSAPLLLILTRLPVKGVSATTETEALLSKQLRALRLPVTS